MRSQLRSTADDAEETSSGMIIHRNPHNKQLSFSTDDHQDRLVGLRFTGMSIPQGAKITKAYVRMRVADTDAGRTTLTFKAQDTDFAPQFRAARHNISSRDLTSASVHWSAPNWRKGSVAQTNDLSKVIQEVVNRRGWDSGNALALVVSSDGKNDRQVVSRNASRRDAAALYVWYTADGGSEATGGSDERDDEVTTPSGNRDSCLNGSGNRIELSGNYSRQVTIRKHRNVKVDARNARIKLGSGSFPFVASNNTGSFCLSGGTYDVGISSGASWHTYHPATALYFYNNVRPIVENVAVLNAGDAFTFKDNNNNFVVRDSYVRRARDDTFENDRNNNGLIEDNLVDNAFTAFSCRAEGSRAPRNVTVTMQNNVIALRQQSNGGSHNDLFKWTQGSSRGCTLRLRNNVFLITNHHAGYVNPENDPQVRNNALDESACRGNKNTIVFMGNKNSRYYAQLKRASPACFEVTTDVSVWNKARDNWFDRHPDLARYR